jgi:hypothetical protein
MLLVPGPGGYHAGGEMRQIQGHPRSIPELTKASREMLANCVRTSGDLWEFLCLSICIYILFLKRRPLSSTVLVLGLECPSPSPAMMGQRILDKGFGFPLPLAM